jgi:hypothetical protein
VLLASSLNKFISIYDSKLNLLSFDQFNIKSNNIYDTNLVLLYLYKNIVPLYTNLLWYMLRLSNKLVKTKQYLTYDKI